jgi:signal transduction histidine kinase
MSPLQPGTPKRAGRRRPALATGLLAALPWTLLAPGAWPAPVVAVLSAGWLFLSWPRRSDLPSRLGRPGWAGLAAVAALLGVLFCVAAPWAATRLPFVPAPDQLPGEVAERYAALWRDLEEAAREAAAGLEPPGDDPELRRAAFRRLSSLGAERRGGSGEAATLLLVDPDGEAAAWAGEGLLNEPDPGEIGRSGLDFIAAFGSVTLVAVEPLGRGARPWRMMAGRSFPTDRWPFDPPLALALPSGRQGVRWSLAAPEDPVAPGAVAIEVAGAPTLVVQRPELPAGAGLPPWRRLPMRLAWGLLAVLLLTVAAVQGLRAALPAGTERQAPAVAGGALSLGLVAGSGLAAAILAGSGGALPALVLAAGAALAVWAGSAERWPGGPWAQLPARPSPWLPAGAAALGALALAAAAWAVLEAVGGTEPGPGSAPDLASRLWPGAAALALRLGLGALALALLLFARRPTGAGRSATAPGFEAWAWAGIGALLGAAALHDRVAASLPLLAMGAAACAHWAGGRRLRHPLQGAILILGAALLGATAWETAHRLEVKREMGRAFLPGMAPPSEQELRSVEAELREHFQGLDLASRVPRSPAGLDREDLAFFLWRRSPLARPNALSALVVEPLEGPPSVFAFGPPVASEEGPHWNVVRREEWALPVWEDSLASGDAVLDYAGEPWAQVRYWLLPRPGYGLGDPEELEPIELGLLRGRPAADRRVRGLPEPALYGLYDPQGRALLSPWVEAPPLPGRLAAGDGVRRRVSTPAQPAWAWALHGRDGIEVLYLPVLGMGPALERVGSHALGSLAVLALAAGVLVLLALPRPAFRDLLGRTFRSYSKRLIVVFTLLLLVPLLLLNLVILSDAEERLNREQRAAGEAALASAQRVIGDFVASLEPGFGFATEVDDELLMWLSRVAQHDVNLYWGSSIWASSKPELFAAGLLPERIPGEVFSRLTLRGYGLASRTNLARGIEYLELYAPLRIPGAPAEQERLFLSLPLLTQQEEVARELASLKRRVILVSAGLFGLLIAVGVGLARRFSQPLEELVAGTRRIAAGAPSLGMAPPSELEIGALVEAVDDMAGRIAESRSRLEREKEVVDRMVENITSGVVSLDRERRVLMHNRVAAELLGVAVGEGLDAALARSERLAPVRAVLAAADRRPIRTTVRLPARAEAGGEGNGEGEREWSLVWVPVPGEGEPTALLVVEDATEVLRGQRLEAWAEMARIIAHEIKNPLTPLRLSAEHLREVFRGVDRRKGAGLPSGFAEVFDRCTENILRQVEELRQIATEFSAFSSVPRIEARPGDLVAALRTLVEAYGSAERAGVEVSLRPESAEVRARFDPRLLGRAVRNLIENAVRASAGGGRVEVRIASENGMAEISVADSGPGVPPELLGRIFDPYFSTHDTGTGLGLPIARRVAEEHGGAIAARNLPGGGLEVTIRIPL